MTTEHPVKAHVRRILAQLKDRERMPRSGPSPEPTDAAGRGWSEGSGTTPIPTKAANTSKQSEHERSIGHREGAQDEQPE